MSPFGPTCAGGCSDRLDAYLVAKRGCPMDNGRLPDDAPDIPAQLALIVFVSLWGLLTSGVALQLAKLGH